jgi:hypothetical protein
MTAPSVQVGSLAILQKVMRDEGASLDQAAEVSTFCGLSIQIDARVPDGVYCLVPPGQGLASAKVGALAPEYTDAARSFALMLQMAQRLQQ